MKVLIILLALIFLPHHAVADTLRLGIANYATQGLHRDLIEASITELKNVLRPKNDLEVVNYTEGELAEAINNHQIALLSKIICSLTLASTFTVNPGPRKLKVINKPLLIK